MLNLRVKPVIVAVGIFLFLLSFGVLEARAEYTHDPINQIDPALLVIDEDNFLGARLDQELKFTGSDGVEFTLGSMLDKPLLLVLSYYECDGVCSTINMDLKKTLMGAAGVQPGVDYRVLTVSFNKDDTPETRGMFAKKLDLSGNFEKSWKVATFNNPEDIKGLTGELGYNYFWSNRDRVFIHPNVFIFISPEEGRVSRYLYGANLKGFDIELAVAEAGFARLSKSRVKDIKNFLLVACYSYNFKEGSFVLNYPLFIAAGSLFSGVSLVLVSLIIYRKKKKREVRA
jgi:protein SCO1/2